MQQARFLRGTGERADAADGDRRRTRARALATEHGFVYLLRQLDRLDPPTRRTGSPATDRHPCHVRLPVRDEVGAPLMGSQPPDGSSGDRRPRCQRSTSRHQAAGPIVISTSPPARGDHRAHHQHHPRHHTAIDHARATPDLIMYFQVHQAMRHSSAELHTALVGIADDDRRRAAAIARWYRGFAAELHTHHHIEDEIFFPALAARVPTFEHLGPDLDADHVHLAQVIDDLGRALDSLAGDEPWSQTRAEAVELAAELRDHLHTHLEVEDQDVIPLFERHFTVEEYVGAREAGRQGRLASRRCCSPARGSSRRADARDPGPRSSRASRPRSSCCGS